MRAPFHPRRRLLQCAGILAMLAACATPVHGPERYPALATSDPLKVINRISWGATTSSFRQATTTGLDAYLDSQLHPRTTSLPAPVQNRIAAMTIAQRPLDQLVSDMEQRRKSADALPSAEDRQAAHQAYQQEMNRLAHEAATRSLLRDLYSPNQLQEQMTWFWMNHFSIHQGKHNLRIMIGDFEERAIRPHALGKFRDLLAATVRHPAMLRYLDNEQNAVKHINENYARELMELHTLGVDGGYSQHDVQELARILTGLGIHHDNGTPNVRPELRSQYVREGLFEFNPNRHDYGDKRFLGATVHGHGLAEVDDALDRLSRHPATARFISRKLATYFVSDDPPAALIERMAQAFSRSDGDIAATLGSLFRSPEFAQALGHKFKDPVHYVVSAVRLAYDDKPILNAGPLLNWLNRMGEPLYGHPTPDGYPMTAAAWASPGQMTTRFEIAKAIGSGNAGLFRSDDPQPVERPAFPQLANALYFQKLQPSLHASTRQALEQATSPQEWNTFLLASPEIMYR